MKSLVKTLLALAIIITVTAVVTWQATGGDYYTKFEVVEQVDKEIADDDPLAAAGFYEGSSQSETVTRKDFRFGLLPTPQGLLDKHILSVVSVSMPFWVFTMIVVWWTWRKSRQGERAVSRK